MSQPPAKLDGARVLWWAWAEDEPFGKVLGDGDAEQDVFGFAVCQYEAGQIYRFTCNCHWEVVQDLDHANEEEAKADIPTQYDVSRVVWNRYQASPICAMTTVEE